MNRDAPVPPAEAEAPPQLRLEIGIDASGRSRIARRRVSWPWSLPRGYHLHGAQGPLTVLPQAAGAGLLPGDLWRHEIAVERHARLRLVEAGSTVVHRAKTQPGRLRWRLSAGAGATLALFAQPFVMMEGAQLQQQFLLTLHPHAVVVLADGFCLRGGAPDPALDWRSDLDARLEDGTPLLRDAQSVTGAELARLAKVHESARAFGAVTLLAPRPTLDLLRQDLPDGAFCAGGAYGAVGPLRRGAGLALRLACPDGGALTQAMAAIQTRIERRLFG
ncbi:urease accessory protein UreD [Pseudodonghicola flavimaris]|uniref:Urease accessory protein UreD n=1 Tax=Pseudodonghicola flavimaris TaxID=3050036 RepID=A0ABT7F1U1_9RHOB|nr:urease accessory protein UreD [Pseudodonghicola flavimaris]MDK3018540.1 urease accessory protein UreD [Pseudodonghicola flavimaris]